MKKIKGKDGQDIAILETDNCICRFVQESGQLDHDTNVNPIACSYIPIGGVVIDIGCFIADNSLAYIKKVGESGNVIGFEPNKEAYRCMMFNMKKYDNFTGENKALGLGGHRASIIKVADNDGMNYLCSGDDIQVYSLDEIFIKENNLDRIDFIKIDAEGSELDILIGGKETISKYKPVMMIEINQMTLERKGIKREDIYNHLESIGYKFKNVYKGHGLNEYQMDIICEPR